MTTFRSAFAPATLAITACAITALATPDLATPASATPARAAAPDADTPADTAAVLLSLAGRWEGELKYRDYQSDEIVTLPATRTAERSGLGPFLFQGFSIADPGHAVQSYQIVALEGTDAVSLIMMSERGLVRETYEVREADVRDPMTAWRLVLQTIGTDDHRPADIRLTQTLENGVLASRKDVRFHDVGVWEFRNETRFERTVADPQTLVGTWQVDLRPTPDAPAHFAELHVEAVEDGRIRGTFYGSPIRDGAVNVHWGALHFAFISDDGTGAYHTSGVVRDGRLEGRTYSAAREFLSVWSAQLHN